MKIKENILIACQILLVYLQIIQVHFVWGFTASFWMMSVVYFGTLVFVYLKKTFLDKKPRWVNYIILLATVSLVVLLNLDTVMFVKSALEEMIQQDNMEKMIQIVEVLSSDTAYGYYFLICEFLFVRFIAKIFNDLDFNFIHVYNTIAVFIFAFYMKKIMIGVLVFMALLIILLTLVRNTQGNGIRFNKKIMVPLTASLIVASLLSAIITPMIDSRRIDPIHAMMSGLLAVTKAIDNCTDVALINAADLEEIEAYVDAGVDNLKDYEYESSQGGGGNGGVGGSSDEGSQGDSGSSSGGGSGFGSGGSNGNSGNGDGSGGSNGNSGNGDGSGSSSLSVSVAKPGLGNGTISNIEIDMSNPYDVLIVRSSTPISRLKVYSGGYYDYNTKSFSRSSSRNMLNTIQKINQMLPSGITFENIFVSKDNHNMNLVSITNIAAPNVVYVPYGRLYFSINAFMHEDNYFGTYNPIDLNRYDVYFSQTAYFQENFPYPEAIDLYTEAVYQDYLQVPGEMKYELQQYLLNHGIDYTSPNKGALIQQIKNLLQTQYTYTTKPGDLPEGKDVILYFLNENKKGYCNHFASAATLLLRTCGIPARYVSGYTVPSSKLGESRVLSNNAHAWTEVFQKDQGWIPVEVTASATDYESGGGSGNGAGTSTDAEMNNFSPDKNQPQDIDQMYQTPDSDSIQNAVTEQTKPSENGSSSGNGQGSSNSQSGGSSGGANSGESSNGSSGNNSGGSNGGSSQEPSSGGSNSSGGSSQTPSTPESSNSSSDNNSSETSSEENKQEDPEENEDEKQEEEIENDEKENELEGMGGGLDFSIPWYVVIPLVGLIAAAVYYLYYRHKNKEITLLSQIYACYDLFVKYDYVDDQIESTMLRIRYSQYPESEQDLAMFLEHKEKLIQHLIEHESYFKKIKIYLFDHLPVFEKTNQHN